MDSPLRPAVSVVVPLYNKGQTIERAVRSILTQDRQDFEVIVVDDGSTDDGAAIVDTIADPRVRLIRQKNAGPGAARNRGIALASAPVTAFLDADDEWSPAYLSRALAALAAAPRAVAAVSGFVYDPPARQRDRWERRGVREGLFEAGATTPVAQLIAVVEYMTTITTVARTETLRALGGFYADGCRYGEDAALMILLALNGPIVLSREPLAVYHRDASDLNRRDRGMRPIEPFLLAPEAFVPLTPPELRALLARFLSARAFKTACVLTYWGRWREGRALLARFRVPRDWDLPLWAAARFGVNPLGAAAASLLRTSRRLVRSTA